MKYIAIFAVSALLGLAGTAQAADHTLPQEPRDACGPSDHTCGTVFGPFKRL